MQDPKVQTGAIESNRQRTLPERARSVDRTGALDAAGAELEPAVPVEDRRADEPVPGSRRDHEIRAIEVRDGGAVHGHSPLGVKSGDERRLLAHAHDLLLVEVVADVLDALVLVATAKLGDGPAEAVLARHGARARLHAIGGEDEAVPLPRLLTPEDVNRRRPVALERLERVAGLGEQHDAVQVPLVGRRAVRRITALLDGLLGDGAVLPHHLVDREDAGDLLRRCGEQPVLQDGRDDVGAQRIVRRDRGVVVRQHAVRLELEKHLRFIATA